MSRPDPMLECNRHVRKFAQRNGLRVVVREDGEVAIPCGRRDSEAHASFGFHRPDGKPGLCWQVWFTHPRPGFALASIAADGALEVEPLDGEGLALIADGDRLLGTLDASKFTKPQRRRKFSPEARAVATARLASLRNPSAVPSPALQS